MFSVLLKTQCSSSNHIQYLHDKKQLVQAFFYNINYFKAWQSFKHFILNCSIMHSSTCHGVLWNIIWVILLKVFKIQKSGWNLSADYFLNQQFSTFIQLTQWGKNISIITLEKFQNEVKILKLSRLHLV